MYDIHFFKNYLKLSFEKINSIENELEKIRNKEPHIYNIETTNYCI